MSGGRRVAACGSAGEVPAGSLELAEHGAVDDLVADLDPDAPDDLLVDDDLELDGPAVDALQGTGQALPLQLVERRSPR